MFNLEKKDVNRTTCQHPLTVDHAFDLFDVMNLSQLAQEEQFDSGNDDETSIFLLAKGYNVNYTLGLPIRSSYKTKHMVVFEGTSKAISHQACVYPKLTTPWLPISVYIGISLVIVMLVVVWSINTVRKRASSSPPPPQRPWARFLSTLRRSNTEPQNDSG